MRISRKTAGKGIIILNLFTICVFLLVILKVIPYESISGVDGWRADDAAVRTATTSIVMMIYGIPVIAAASGLVR